MRWDQVTQHWPTHPSNAVTCWPCFLCENAVTPLVLFMVNKWLKGSVKYLSHIDWHLSWWPLLLVVWNRFYCGTCLFQHRYSRLLLQTGVSPMQLTLGSTQTMDEFLVHPRCKTSDLCKVWFDQWKENVPDWPRLTGWIVGSQDFNCYLTNRDSLNWQVSVPLFRHRRKEQSIFWAISFCLPLKNLKMFPHINGVFQM